jgi:DNA ligase D-like protein (predicted ligase)
LTLTAGLAGLEPMLATVASSLPQGGQWSYEVKWDGYRALLVKRGARVELISRKLKNLAADYPQLITAGSRWPHEALVLDGEIVALDPRGLPSFQALQHRGSAPAAIVFYAFDLLQAGAVDYRCQPLAVRREALRQLSWAQPFRLSEPLAGEPREIEAAVRSAGLEGVVAKRTDSIYEPGVRSDAWVKVKFSLRQEFVVAGYKPDGRGFDSVLVGFHDGPKLLFAGKVRAGFTAHTRREVARRLLGLERQVCPFANLPNATGRTRWGEGITAEDMRELRWVEPRVVVEVAFTEWTPGGNLRHAAFVGIREDKDAKDVHRSA